MLYYGFRYYNAKAGRWASRDPIGEWGGVNLTAVVGNNFVDWIDRLGLQLPEGVVRQYGIQIEGEAGQKNGDTGTKVLAAILEEDLDENWKPTTTASKLNFPEEMADPKYVYKELTLILITWNRRGVRDRTIPKENIPAGLLHYVLRKTGGEGGPTVMLLQKFTARISNDSNKAIELVEKRQNTWKAATTARNERKSDGSVGAASILSIDRNPTLKDLQFSGWEVHLTYSGFGGWTDEKDAAMKPVFEGGAIETDARTHPSWDLPRNAGIPVGTYLTGPGVVYESELPSNEHARDIKDLHIHDNHREYGDSGPPPKVTLKLKRVCWGEDTSK